MRRIINKVALSCLAILILISGFPVATANTVSFAEVEQNSILEDATLTEDNAQESTDLTDDFDSDYIEGLSLFDAEGLDPNLVLNLKFEDSVIDSSTAATAVTPYGSPNYVPGAVGKGIELKSDATQYITIDDQDESMKFGTDTSFSVSFWVKKKGTSADPAIISNKDWGSGGNQGWVMSLKGSGIHWNYKTSDGARKDADIPNVNDDKWHHITAVHDRTEGKAHLYKDGQLVKTVDISDMAGTIDTTYPTQIGRDGKGGVDGVFDAQLDELRVYRKALGEDEIVAMYEESPLSQLEEKFNGTLDIGGAEQTVQGAEFRVNLTLKAPTMTSVLNRIFVEVAYDSTKFEFVDGTNMESTPDLTEQGVVKLWINQSNLLNSQEVLEYRTSEISELYFKAIASSGTGDIAVRSAEFYAGKQKFEIESLTTGDQTVTINAKAEDDLNKDGLMTIGDIAVAENPELADLQRIAANSVFAPYKRVVFIGIDGAGVGVTPDAPYWATKDAKGKIGDQLNVPYLRSLIETGAVSYTAQSCLPSMSSPNWQAMFTGQGCVKHGLDNSKTGKYYYDETNYPTIFKMIRAAAPQRNIASFATWEQINSGHIEQSIGVEQRTRTNGIGRSMNSADDELIKDYAVGFINEGKLYDTSLMYVYFGLVDDVGGHGNGWYMPTFYQTLADTDKRVEQVVEAIKHNGLMDDTLLVIMPDHGGGTEESDGTLKDETSHGQDNALNRTIFIAANGRTVATEVDGEKVFKGGKTSDLAAIVLTALGIADPNVGEAVVPEGLFADQKDQNKEDAATLSLHKFNDSSIDLQVSDLETDAKVIDFTVYTEQFDKSSVSIVQPDVEILHTETKNRQTRVILYGEHGIQPNTPIIRFQRDSSAAPVLLEQGMIADAQGKESMPNLKSLESNASLAWSENSELVVSELGEDKLTLSWNAASETAEILQYKVLWSGETVFLSGTARSVEMTGLEPDSNYNFKVEALAADSNWSTNGPGIQIKTLSDEGDLVAAFLEDVKNELPNGQNVVSYANNYQSMEPEPMSFRSGAGSSSVNNGLTVNITSVPAVAAWDKGPWLSAGVIDAVMRYDSSSANNIGFVIGAYNSTQGTAIRYDGGTDWVIQKPDGSGSWEVFKGPALAKNTDYHIQIGFKGKHLLVAVDGTVYYNQETDLLSDIAKMGQVALYKRYATGTILVKSLKIEGVGQVEKPLDIINYVQDFEDENYQPNWFGLNTAVVTDDTGNKVLSVKRGTGERGVDLDAPKLQTGTLSLDFKLKNPAKLGNGQGFAFGFRMSDNAGVFNEIGVDPNMWIPESSQGWGSSLPIPYPTQGRWNNLMFNFKDKTITVYLNKKKIGDISFDKFTAAEGRFGMRVRSSVEMHIDNVRYTNEIIEPQQIIEYRNDFEDGISGKWAGADASLVQEGNNKLLKLSGLNGIATNLDAPLLRSATYMASIKSASNEIGLAIGSGATVKYNGGKWALSHGGQTIDFVKQDALESTPLVRKWNKIGLQYTDSSVVLSINGAKLEASLSGGAQFGEGRPGVAGSGDVYVDNIVYTEEFIELNTAQETGKLYYEEHYEAISDVEWTGLAGAAVANGYLSGAIAAGSVAELTAVTPLENAIYQVKLQAEQELAGLKLGNLAIYHTGQGSWVYRYDGGSETAIGTGPAIQPDKDIIIRLQMVEKALKLYVNGSLIGSIEATDFTKGAFALYNPGLQELAVKVDAVGAEEIRIYTPDYGTPNWKVLEGTPSVVAGSAGSGEVTLNMPGVALATDDDAPAMIDQTVSFDFQTDVAADATGGRYGFMLRALDNRNYVSIVHDINGTWRLSAGGNESNYPVAYAMEANKKYHVELTLNGSTAGLKITNENNETTDLGTVTDSQIMMEPGKFGLRSWYAAKKMTISNMKIVEHGTLPSLQLATETDTIANGDMTVTVNKDFPSIMSYQLGDKVLPVGTQQEGSLFINGVAYTPQTAAEKINSSTYQYVMNVAEIGVSIKAVIEAKERNIVRFEVAGVEETGDFMVRTLKLNNAVFNVNSTMEGSSYAWGKSDGKWHGITEDLVDDISRMETTGTFSATMVMVSANGVGASIETNVISGGGRVVLNAEKKPLVNMLTVKPGEWTYRHAQSVEKENLPWYEVVLTEDKNADGKVNWQDAAVAYRNEIFRKPFGAEDMKNNLMYIAFNFASQANDPFLNTLDTGKVLYNYTDGFGQMILHKGYQGEGHDDEIPSYSNIGIRQGGLKDFNYLIDEGAKYNLKVGVHLNATEYHLDANELYYPNFDRATAAGYTKDNLAGGWDWIDTSYYVDQTKDVLSGQLKSRFTNLYNLTKDPSNPNDPALDFYYIDVYTGNDYNAYKLLEYANNLGVRVGTEFAGPMEPGVTFVHWGPDLGYPNKGNGSILSRMVKNELDLFTGNALFKGQKIPGVTTWGDSKPDVQQGVFVFFNEVLPTKFMQHYGVMKYETDQVTFDDNVVSKRNTTNNRIELSKDGKLISYWKDTGTTTDESVRHTGEANSLIPWVWDIKTNEVLGINEGAKLYHWNTTGSATTWELTDEFKDVPTFHMYELTQQGKVLVDTITAANGTIVINKALKNTPYVLYPASADALLLTPAAGEWGEGSLIRDFAFNSEKLNAGAWNADNTSNIAIKQVSGDTGYDTTVEHSKVNWNRYVEINANGGTLSQSISGLVPGQDYTVGVWTQTPKGRKASLEVTVGDSTYSNYVSGLDGMHSSSFKYLNTTWQRMNVKFTAPADGTNAMIKLKAEAGEGAVLFDDARIWNHTTSSNDLTKPGYVVYEDFENVYEGWGPFEYGGGSRQIHIASYQSNVNANNPLVPAGESKVGPAMTWVLGGTSSLKVNETDVGRSIKTNESSVKLEPNKKYELGFIYTMEPNVTYEVVVKSRSTGQTVLQETLQTLANPGTRQGEAGGYNRYQKTFTTTEQDDFQIVFQLKSKTGSGASSKFAFILDDFYIKLDGATFWKAELDQVIAEAQQLKSDDYTAESWEAVAETLSAAIEAAANSAATAAELEAAATALKQAVSALVPVVTITDIDAVAVETTVGKAPVLPAEVTVQYSNETSGKLAVVWDAVDPAQYAKAGSFQVEGTVAGTELKAVANVTVTGKSEEEEQIAQLKAAIGETVARAEQLKAGDYTTESWAVVAAAWDAAVKAAEEAAPTAAKLEQALNTFKSALDALVRIVTITDIDAVSVETTVGKAPVLPAEVTVQYSNETSGKLAVVWDAVDPAQYAKAGSFEVKGTVAGTELQAVANVTVTGKSEEEEQIAQLKAAIGETVARAEQLKAGDYTTESWAVVAAAWDAAVKAAAEAAPTAAKLEQALNIFKSALDALVRIVTITDIDAVSVETTVGKAPVLSAEVTVQYSNETSGKLAVVWDAVDPVQYAKAGSFQVEGTVGGTELKAVANVTVKPSDSGNPNPTPNPGGENGNNGNNGNGNAADSTIIPKKELRVIKLTTADGRTVNRVEVPFDVLAKTLAAAQAGSVDGKTAIATIKATDIAGSIQLTLSGKTLAEAAAKHKDTVIRIESDSSIYELPLNSLSLGEFASQQGVSVDGVTVQVSVETASDELMKLVKQKADELGAGLALDQAIKLQVVLAANGQQQVLEGSGDRILYLDKAIASAAMAPVMFDSATGEFVPVPGKLVTIDGKQAIVLKHLGNSLYTVLSYSKSFEDLNGHWAKSDVEIMASRLIVKGMTDTTFSPDKNITRAEFAALLIRALGLTQDAEAATNFADVEGTAWYAGFIGTATKFGIVNGTGDNKFEPGKEITREEMAVMVSRALRMIQGEAVEQGNGEGLEKFKDAASVQAWALAPISELLDLGIMNGTAEDTFAPTEAATRAQAAVILLRAMRVLEFIN